MIPVQSSVAYRWQTAGSYQEA